MDSAISQGGANVSGGQKQRLAIARALAKKPEIFIFDDSFSALDLKTDAALRKALKENTAESTVIVVAQRVSTIMNAEQIIVLDQGEIVGCGTHKELLENCTQYYEIASSQLSRGGISVSEENNRTKDSAKRSPMGGGMMPGMMPGAKAKNFKGSLVKLISYLGKHSRMILLVCVLAIFSTVFTILGPKILGDAIDVLFTGVMSQIAGTGGIDFKKIGEILLLLVGLYGVGSLFTYLQGYVMSQVYWQK